jgi:hypothetical protein
MVQSAVQVHTRTRDGSVFKPNQTSPTSYERNRNGGGGGRSALAGGSSQQRRNMYRPPHLQSGDPGPSANNALFCKNELCLVTPSPSLTVSFFQVVCSTPRYGVDI